MGPFLWRYDMGWAVEEGIWYSAILVYDLDGDRKAEVYTKAGEGDPRESTGHVRSGPEYLVKLDGRRARSCNACLAERDGFDDYNYYSAICSHRLSGWPTSASDRRTRDLPDHQGPGVRSDLLQKWYWEASGEYQGCRGQGMHGLHAADLDEDERTRLILVLRYWTTMVSCSDRGVGHPDVCYVADVDPRRPVSRSSTASKPRQRATRSAWSRLGPASCSGGSRAYVHVHGQGMWRHRSRASGMECYAGEAKGDQINCSTRQAVSGSPIKLGELSPKAVYWLDGPTQGVHRPATSCSAMPREQIGHH